MAVHSVHAQNTSPPPPVHNSKPVQQTQPPKNESAHVQTTTPHKVDVKA